MLFNGSQKYNIYYDIPNKLLKFTINSDKKSVATKATDYLITRNYLF